MAAPLTSIALGATVFREGDSGPLVAIDRQHRSTECGASGKAKCPALSTELSHNISGHMLSLEVVETHWDKKVSPTIPNDTATHRVRIHYGRYKNMPAGRHFRVDIPLTKLVDPAAVDGDAVTLQVKDAASLKWSHNPGRLFGDWGERERGPFVHLSVPPVSVSAPLSAVRLTFGAPVDAAAFAQSLASARNPAPAKANKSNASGGENGNPQGGGAPANALLPLEGRSFVFTGDAPGREKREGRVAALGGKVTSAVSGRTAYLVAYDTTTVKYKKARDLQREGKPGPRIVDQAGVDAVLDEAAATREAAKAALDAGGAAASSSAAGSAQDDELGTAVATAATPAASAGPSDEPEAKRQCIA